MISPMELRGMEFKRYVRAAAALVDLFDDTAIATALGLSRNTVGRWWSGAQPEPETLGQLADVTGLSRDELSRFTYYDGPPPHLPQPEDAEAAERADAAERSHRARPEAGASAGRPAPRGSAGSGR